MQIVLYISIAIFMLSTVFCLTFLQKQIKLLNQKVDFILKYNQPISQKDMIDKQASDLSNIYINSSLF